MSKHPQQQEPESTGRLIGDRFRLAVARDVVRIYADERHDPSPPLKRLIACLESKAQKPRA